MNDRYDVVVAGAGCGGSVFAARVAGRGFKVLILDRQRREAIGPEWSDLVESDAFELAGVDRPVPPEACPAVGEIDVVASGGRRSISVSGEPYTVVDRRLLAERLVGLAGAAGAEVLTQCIVGGVEVEKGAVVSVQTDRGTFRTGLAVDASGIDRVLCRGIPRGMGIPRVLSSRDYVSLYREARELKNNGGPPAQTSGMLCQPGRFGGYSWLRADEGAGLAYIGTAVQDLPIYPDPRYVTHTFASANPLIGDRIARVGGGRVPSRRPLNTMVASGFMALGDAACNALPMVGRGVGAAMAAAVIAADAAAFALEARDLSPYGLWSYNYCYMRERGAHAAALDSVRVYLQGIPRSEFARLLDRGVLDESDISNVMLGRFETHGTHARIKAMLKGVNDFSLLVRFESALRHARRVFDHYMGYPALYDPLEFEEWSRESDYLFEDAERLNERALLAAAN